MRVNRAVAPYSLDALDSRLNLSNLAKDAGNIPVQSLYISIIFFAKSVCCLVNRSSFSIKRDSRLRLNEPPYLREMLSTLHPCVYASQVTMSQLHKKDAPKRVLDSIARAQFRCHARPHSPPAARHRPHPLHSPNFNLNRGESMGTIVL